jgi:hypothetical protein
MRALQWVKIERACAVLLDPLLRQIYDEFGPEGLRLAETTVLKMSAAGSGLGGGGRSYSSGGGDGGGSSVIDDVTGLEMEVGFHTPAAERVLETVREAVRTRNQNELMARLECNSMVQMDVGLDALFDGGGGGGGNSDSDSSGDGGIPSVGSEGGVGAHFFTMPSLGLIEVPSMVMTQSVVAPLSAVDRLTLSAFIVTRDGLGYGDLRAEWRRTLQPGRTFLVAGVGAPFSRSANLMLQRRLDEAGNTLAVGASVQRGTLGMNVTLSHPLGKRDDATLSFKLGGSDPGLSVERTYTTGGSGRGRGRRRRRGNSNSDGEDSSDDDNSDGGDDDDDDDENGGTATTTYGLYVSEAGVQAGVPGMGVHMSHSRQLGSNLHFSGRRAAAAATVKVGARFGFNEAEVSLNLAQRLSTNSRLGSSLTADLSGVSLKFKYRRGASTFVLPLRFSKSSFGHETPWAIFWAAVCEGAIYFGVERLMEATRRKQRGLVVRKRAKEVRKARKDARTQQSMMGRRAAEIARREERKFTGLVILAARFGDALDRVYGWDIDSVDHHQASHRGDDDPEDSGDNGNSDITPPPLGGGGQDDDVVSGMHRYQSDGRFYPPNIDVMTPLQFLVGDDSILRIPSDVAKSRMLGFCDPSLHVGVAAGGVAPLESSRLFVRYAFAGRVFEITVGEREELVLPSPKAREVGERYRHTFSNVRLVAHRQALQVLRAGAHPEDAVQPMGAWVAGSSGRSSSSSCSGGGSVRVGVGGGESKSGTYSSRDGALADINDMD